MEMEREILRLMGVLSQRWTQAGEQAPERLLQPLEAGEKAELLRLLTLAAAGGREPGGERQRGGYRPGLRPTGPLSRGPVRPPRFRGEASEVGQSDTVPARASGSYERLPDGGVRCMECQVGCQIRRGDDGKPVGFRCPLGQKLAAGLNL